MSFLMYLALLCQYPRSMYRSDVVTRLSRTKSIHIWWCFLCVQVSFRNLETKLENFVICPETLGFMLEY